MVSSVWLASGLYIGTTFFLSRAQRQEAEVHAVMANLGWEVAISNGQFGCSGSPAAPGLAYDIQAHHFCMCMCVERSIIIYNK